jgi:hypothetical protein
MASSALARGLAWLRRRAAVQEALQERRQLLDRPWEEDFLHWHRDGDRWVLHGHAAPPADGRRHSTTRDGWCPGGLPRSRRPPGGSVSG